MRQASKQSSTRSPGSLRYCCGLRAKLISTQQLVRICIQSACGVTVSHQAAVSSLPADALELDEEAVILNDVDACPRQLLGGGVVADAQLEPD